MAKPAFPASPSCWAVEGRLDLLHQGGPKPGDRGPEEKNVAQKRRLTARAAHKLWKAKSSSPMLSSHNLLFPNAVWTLCSALPTWFQWRLKSFPFLLKRSWGRQKRHCETALLVPLTGLPQRISSGVLKCTCHPSKRLKADV